ncbi:MAG: HEAT repeat domain-containing protein [Candidatus Dormibacteria bacterium]
MASIWGMTPQQSMEAECARRGKSAVVSGCVDLLQGREVEDALVLALGGPHAEYVLSGGEGGRHGRWPRVWACRGLLYAWEKEATPAIVQATKDEAWRVREMAAKVIARHRIEDAIGAVVGLQGDPVTRVRAAAERAVIGLYDPGRT